MKIISYHLKKKHNHLATMVVYLLTPVVTLLYNCSSGNINQNSLREMANYWMLVGGAVLLVCVGLTTAQIGELQTNSQSF